MYMLLGCVYTFLKATFYFHFLVYFDLSGIPLEKHTCE